MVAAAPLMLLAAGGTGGHLFPAEALAEALARRGIAVELATDARGGRYGGKFPARQVHVVPSATVRGRNPLSLARTAAVLGYGMLRAHILLGRLKPAIVVGFGGYPTVPPVLAATLAENSHPHPRAERGHGPRQPAAGAAGERDRDELRRCPRCRCDARRQGHAHRQSAAPGGAGGGRGAIRRAGGRRTPAPARFRRQPGRQDHVGYRAGGDREARSGGARAPPARPAGARGGFAACPRYLRPPQDRRRGGAVLRRSAGADRGGPPCRLALRARAPSPSLPRSAGRRFSFRCRMRSTRISSPMPACWRRRAGRCACARTTSRPSVSPPRSVRLPARRKNS